MLKRGGGGGGNYVLGKGVPGGDDIDEKEVPEGCSGYIRLKQWAVVGKAGCGGGGGKDDRGWGVKRLEGRIERLFKMLKHVFSFWIFLLVGRGCQLREAMSVECSDFHFLVMILLANFGSFSSF